MPDITCLTSDEMPAALSDLTDILWSSVHNGASVGFILPFKKADARAFWQDRVFPAVLDGSTTLFVAHQAGRITGTVQLGHVRTLNQPHRADVAKMLVHPDHRRLGLGRALMVALEDHARMLGKTLLVLDTRSGDAAQILYQSLGFQVAGEIPGYCRNPLSDEFEATTYLYKPLA